MTLLGGAGGGDGGLGGRVGGELGGAGRSMNLKECPLYVDGVAQLPHVTV